MCTKPEASELARTAVTAADMLAGLSASGWDGRPCSQLDIRHRRQPPVTAAHTSAWHQGMCSTDINTTLGSAGGGSTGPAPVAVDEEVGATPLAPPRLVLACVAAAVRTFVHAPAVGQTLQELRPPPAEAVLTEGVTAHVTCNASMLQRT